MRCDYGSNSGNEREKKVQLNNLINGATIYIAHFHLLASSRSFFTSYNVPNTLLISLSPYIYIYIYICISIYLSICLYLQIVQILNNYKIHIELQMSSFHAPSNCFYNSYCYRTSFTLEETKARDVK